jgi:hypothetical protein
MQDMENGLGDGVDLLHSLANSSEHLDTLEEAHARGAAQLPAAKRQRTKRGGKAEERESGNDATQMAHEECAAIISDMKSLSAANSPWAASNKRGGRKASVGNLSANSHSVVSMSSVQLTGNGVFDMAAGNSLATAAFGTPSASGGMSGGLHDICSALWSAAPLQTRDYSSHVLGSPLFKPNASAPHPSMHSKYKKPAGKPTKAAAPQVNPAAGADGTAEDVGGVMLNMDVMDYAAVVKGSGIKAECMSPRSDEYCAMEKSNGSVTTSESECDAGESFYVTLFGALSLSCERWW